jgi:DNA primase
MTSLEEAIANGQGVERPFKCFVHEDHMASASVNVIKGVWYCFSCQAHGNIDKKRSPKVEELRSMMEAEKTPRIYDPAFLELYSDPVYWTTRFAPWVCWQEGLGEDPFTGDATFPVHTAAGRLAGVGRRRVEAMGDKSTMVTRYLYPHGWSAASSLFGMGGKYIPSPVLTLVEGAADATSIWEVGCAALAVYGSGVHLPQYELIARCNPAVVLIGFDMDTAGERAALRALDDMSGLYLLQRVHWPRKDPADCTPQERRAALESAVGISGYSQDMRKVWDMTIVKSKMNYQRFVEGIA